MATTISRGDLKFKNGKGEGKIDQDNYLHVGSISAFLNTEDQKTVTIEDIANMIEMLEDIQTYIKGMK